MTTKTSLLALAAAALLSLGASAASAQNYIPFDTSAHHETAAAAPVASPAQPEYTALAYQGRSSALAGRNASSRYDESASITRH